jgi:hypothetical protein
MIYFLQFDLKSDLLFTKLQFQTHHESLKGHPPDPSFFFRMSSSIAIIVRKKYPTTVS